MYENDPVFAELTSLPTVSVNDGPPVVCGIDWSAWLEKLAAFARRWGPVAIMAVYNLLKDNPAVPQWVKDILALIVSGGNLPVPTPGPVA